jgi:hypothetical protein
MLALTNVVTVDWDSIDRDETPRLFPIILQKSKQNKHTTLYSHLNFLLHLLLFNNLHLIPNREKKNIACDLKKASV